MEHFIVCLLVISLLFVTTASLTASTSTTAAATTQAQIAMRPVDTVMLEHDRLLGFQKGSGALAAVELWLLLLSVLGAAIVDSATLALAIFAFAVEGVRLFAS